MHKKTNKSRPTVIKQCKSTVDIILIFFYQYDTLTPHICNVNQLTAGLDWACFKTWLHFSSRSLILSFSLQHIKYAHNHLKSTAKNWRQVNDKRSMENSYQLQDC